MGTLGGLWFASTLLYLTAQRSIVAAVWTQKRLRGNEMHPSAMPRCHVQKGDNNILAVCTFAILSGKELWNGNVNSTAAVAVAAPESMLEGELACSAKLCHRVLRPSSH